jgi:hypothetical protein
VLALACISLTHDVDEPQLTLSNVLTLLVALQTASAPCSQCAVSSSAAWSIGLELCSSLTSFCR